MSYDQNKKLARQLIEEVMNQGNISLADEILSPDFLNHELDPEFPPTREGFKQGLQMMHAGGLSDLKFTIEDVIAEGDRVVIRINWSGTHTGEFFGMPSSNKRFSVGGIDIFRIAEGQIVEHWGQTDIMGMMQQLGAMPGPE